MALLATISPARRSTYAMIHKSVKKPDACRLCHAPLHMHVCDLGNTPLSNAFADNRRSSAALPVFPLHVMICDACFLMQIAAYEMPDKIFDRAYPYFSSYTQSWVEHAERYVDSICQRLSLNTASQVIEVASNDGYLLQFFSERGVPVLGIDPATACAAAAKNKGIDTWERFFDRATAQVIADSGKQADLLICNNVLAHVDDLNDFVAGLKVALKPEGTITLEVPHLLELIRHTEFDTIYHEHFSYFSLRALLTVFLKHELRIFDVQKLSTHGGSLRVYACHLNNASREVSPNVDAVMREEEEQGLYQHETYASFADAIERVKDTFIAYLLGARSAGKRIAGYGAAAKGNTFLNYCGVSDDMIEFVADISPYKQGRVMPGSHIPIVSPERLLTERPDVVIILPWNIQDEVMAQLSDVLAWGGEFVVAIPELKHYR